MFVYMYINILLFESKCNFDHHNRVRFIQALLRGKVVKLTLIAMNYAVLVYYASLVHYDTYAYTH